MLHNITHFFDCASAFFDFFDFYHRYFVKKSQLSNFPQISKNISFSDFMGYLCFLQLTNSSFGIILLKCYDGM